MPTQQVSRARDMQDCSTIVSIVPVMIDDSKPGLIPSQYIIQAVKDPSNDFAILNVYRARFPVYLDENRPALVVPAPSDTVAESICRDYKTAISYYEPGIAEPGIFWVRGEHDKASIRLNFDGELEEARRLQVVWFKRLVEVAEDDWNRYHLRRVISTIQRIAASFLGHEAEWTNIKDPVNAPRMILCKFCKSDIHPDSVICRHCTGVLNLEAAKRMGYLPTASATTTPPTPPSV